MRIPIQHINVLTVLYFNIYFHSQNRHREMFVLREHSHSLHFSQIFVTFTCQGNEAWKAQKHLLVTGTFVLPALERETPFVPTASGSEDFCHCQLIILCRQGKGGTLEESIDMANSPPTLLLLPR